MLTGTNFHVALNILEGPYSMRQHIPFGILRKTVADATRSFAQSQMEGLQHLSRQYEHSTAVKVTVRQGSSRYTLPFWRRER